jgi:tRNA(Ile)-lysidine synthetase-like protein
MDIQTLRLEALKPGSYVIAVSGGVDSIVLLDLLATHKNEDTKFIVAHFDHGIRQDSHEDETFVRERATHYGLTYASKREDLGKQASEEKARTRRYEFLWSVAREYGAKLITAHHSDDVIETIAINFARGTGWRGLAVLDSKVIRPLLPYSKSELLSYAKQHTLEWHEDSTNSSDAYLRNRMRAKLTQLDPDAKRQLLGLWAQQKHTKQEIDAEVGKLVVEKASRDRYFYTHLDTPSALEILRKVTYARLTRPQLFQLLLAIKTSKAGKMYQAGNGVEIDFTSRNFTVKLIK